MESIDFIPKKELNLNIVILDDENKQISTENLTIDEDIFLAIKGNNIKRYKIQSEINSENKEEILFHVRINKNNLIKLENPLTKGFLFQTERDVEKLDKKLWCLLNSKNNHNNYQNNFQLLQNYIIKIGKMKYIVYEVHIISGNKDKDKKNEDNEIINENGENDYENVNKNTDEIFKRFPEIEYKKCKFCDAYNITLCKCGEKIHDKCFYKIINPNIKITNNQKKTVKTYFIDNFHCKKCYSPFPISVYLTKVNDPLYIINIEKPNDYNYIILESLNHKNEKGRSKKYVHLITLNKDIIKIGRNKNNDIIIDDPSVEDIHAEIKYDEKKEKIIISNISKENEVSILIKNSLQMNEKKIQLKINKIKLEAYLTQS